MMVVFGRHSGLATLASFFGLLDKSGRALMHSLLRWERLRLESLFAMVRGGPPLSDGARSGAWLGPGSADLDMDVG